MRVGDDLILVSVATERYLVSSGADSKASWVPGERRVVIRTSDGSEAGNNLYTVVMPCDLFQRFFFAIWIRRDACFLLYGFRLYTFLTSRCLLILYAIYVFIE